MYFAENFTCGIFKCNWIFQIEVTRFNDYDLLQFFSISFSSRALKKPCQAYNDHSTLYQFITYSPFTFQGFNFLDLLSVSRFFPILLSTVMWFFQKKIYPQHNRFKNVTFTNKFLTSKQFLMSKPKKFYVKRLGWIFLT